VRGTGGGEYAWAVEFMRAKPGWPRVPPPPHLNARTAHAYETATGSGDLYLHRHLQQNYSAAGTTTGSAAGGSGSNSARAHTGIGSADGSSSSSSSSSGGTEDEDLGVLDREAHAWLWDGAPSEEGGKEWDEAQRFEAFVHAVRVPTRAMNKRQGPLRMQ
jgi:hypothetical protein